MEELLDAIGRALRARGWSATQASAAAGASPELIRNIRRGRNPRLDELKALCEVLGLEFYVGVPRHVGAVDERRLEDALEAMERAVEVHGMRLAPRERAHAAAALYALLDRGREPVTAQRAQRLIAALAGERREGPERE